MDTQTPTIVKTNQHYQLTIPSVIRKKMTVDKGSLFTAELISEGILFKPITLNDNNIEYADPFNKRRRASSKGRFR